MRAVQYSRFGGPEVLDVVSLADPVCGDDEILVAMKAATVMPLDWKLRSGQLQQQVSVQFPKIPGRGGAGTVKCVGSRVTGFQPGDRVMVSAPRDGSGTQAELFVCSRNSIATIPEHVSFARGAALVRSGIAAWAGIVSTAGVMPGMHVLIHGGGGGVGSLAIQIARNIGAKVTATCSHADIEHVARLGASQVVAYDRADFSALPDKFDVIFDNVGGDVHVRSRPMLRKGGKLIYFSAAPFSPDSDVPATLIDVDRAVREDGALTRLAEEVAAGRLKPLVFAVFDLDHVKEAYETVEKKINRRGQVVIAFDD